MSYLFLCLGSYFADSNRCRLSVFRPEGGVMFRRSRAKSAAPFLCRRLLTSGHSRQKIVSDFLRLADGGLRGLEGWTLGCVMVMRFNFRH